MRGLIFLLPVLAVFGLMLEQPSPAPSPARISDAYVTADNSSERLVVFEAFLRPG